MKIAVVVCVAEPTPHTQRCLTSCAALTFEPRNILVVSDEPVPLPDDPHFRNLVTHAGYLTSPAEKRDFALASEPEADVFAYLDDDAYVAPDWLDRIAEALRRHPEAAGVGGPGLAPDDHTFWEQVSFAVMNSWLGSGPLLLRTRALPACWADDLPTFDLAIRREWLERVGGWRTDWYAGEETLLCARIADAGALMRYDPSVAVWHYRRALVPRHFWQIQNVGRSRGCFIRGDEPRLRGIQFAGPPAFVVAAVLLLAAPSLAGAWWPWAVGMSAALYAAAAIFGHPRPLDWRVRLAYPLALIVHHVAYSVGLLRGLITNRRKRMRPAGATWSPSWSPSSATPEN